MGIISLSGTITGSGSLAGPVVVSSLHELAADLDGGLTLTAAIESIAVHELAASLVATLTITAATYRPRRRAWMRYTIDPDNYQRQIIVDMVENALLAPLEMEFTGLDLGEYDTLELVVYTAGGGDVLTRAIVADGTDETIGRVTWQENDLPPGKHKAEVQLTVTGSGMTRLPAKYPLILNVRRALVG